MSQALLLLLGLALAAPAAAADTFGRFFFSAEERAQLDAARVHKQRAPAQQQAAAKPVAEPPRAPQVLTYGGIVKRSDGKSILWINNRAADEREALSSLPVTGRVRPDGVVTLQLPDSGRSIELKVGQSAELTTGTVGERAPKAAPAAAGEKADKDARREPESKAPAGEPAAQAQAPAAAAASAAR
jgi:hypothetical protein